MARSPFVLTAMTPLAKGTHLHPGRDFDPVRQLWISQESGLPVVIEHTTDRTARSAFGETMMTKTAEGVDQSEGVRASEWGETMITESGEGVDRSAAISASPFGETMVTATREGIDHSESAHLSLDSQ